MEMNDEQKKAMEIMLSGENVFLTGEAGTGKTFLINRFIEAVSEEKNVMLTAPTGIAALNIGGVTIHRAFEIPIDVNLTIIRPHVSDVLDVTDIVIIDEISMCRMDLFDLVAKCIFKVDHKIQLIVIGDFYQLPPVLLDKDRKPLEISYGKVGNGFAFQGKMWDKFNFKKISLNQVMRQDDADFINSLNRLRVGDRSVLNYFVGNCCKTPIDKAVTIVGTNKRAEQINQRELAKINEPVQLLKAKIFGEVDRSAYPTAEYLELKKGARVMMLVNTDYYKNGSTGVVVDIDLFNIEVRLDKDDRIVFVDKYRWQISEYVEVNGRLKMKVVGEFLQYPMKLAYAITVHKSQGQTYDAVNFEPCGWLHGQLYVALSRAKDIHKLYIAPGLRYSNLICDKSVLDMVE